MRLMIEFSLRLSNQLVCESMYNVHTVTSQTPDPRFRNFQAVSHLQTPAFILYYLENATWISSWTPFLPQLCSRETRTKRTLAESSRDTDAEKPEYLDNVGRVLIELLRMHCTVHVADWTCPKEPRGGLEQYAGACVGRRCLKRGFNSWSQFPVHTSAPGPVDIQNWYY